MPCTARAAISMVPSAAIPAANDDTVKTARPIMKIRRRPKTSARRPPASISPAKTRM